jgi:hypothetical protein
MRSAVLAAALLAGAAPAFAQVPTVPSGVEGQRLSITIYNNDLALVQDARSLDLPGGRSRVELRDVSAAIRPETVSLSGRGLEVVEQNFDFDLLTPAKLMEKAIGREVVVVRTNPGDGRETRETATVLSVNDGVVLRIGDRIEVLRDDGVPTRVIFDKVPETLRARPTLTVTVDAAGAGRRDATLTYLTSGLGWKADYVARFDERAGRLDLQGWITLTNQSGTPFTNADVQLVAGSVSQGGGYDERAMRAFGGSVIERPPPPPPPPMPPGVRRAGMETGQGGRPIADYYLYPLPERTTVAQNQTKQVGFLDSQGVPARKVYEWRQYGFQTLEQPQSAAVTVQFANAAAGGLGAQLPAGTLRVYVSDQAGDPKFVGERNIPHTPQGSELSIQTGDAFDVTVQPTLETQDTQKDSRGRDYQRVRTTYRVRNARPEPVTVDLRVQPGWGDFHVREESAPSRRLDAGTRAWSVPVPANGETVLTVVADNRDERNR